ncbi:MAG: hypothetical protein ACFFAS_12090 [Promethearchaeota archaeon]
MVNAERVYENLDPPEVVGKFYILGDTEEHWIYGEIMLPDLLEKFTSLIKSEIEYSWGSEFADMNEYALFHIDTKNKDDLIEITENEYYTKVRNLDKIFIALIHTSIKYRFIVNIPPLYDWYVKNYLD